MALYKHFHDKDALVEALVARGFALWEERLAAAVADAEGPLERSLRAYRDFALEEARYFELLFLQVRPGYRTRMWRCGTLLRPAFGAVMARVQRDADAGLYRVRDATQLALLMWSLAHGLIALHFTGRFSHDREAFRRIYDSSIATMFALLST
jgi:AcrR family transcriptional regulator